MGTQKEDGGAAFPGLGVDYYGGGVSYNMIGGMSLRDFFAAAALQGVMANDPTVAPDLLKMFGGPGLNRGDVAAKVAYSIADSMLKARKDSPNV